MQKSKLYSRTWFSIKTIQDAYNECLSLVGGAKKVDYFTHKLNRRNESWEYDTINEFYSSFNDGDSYYLRIDCTGRFKFEMFGYSKKEGRIQVSVISKNSQEIDSIFQIFERDVEVSKIIAVKDPVKVFIGHSHDDQWRLLKDHLHDLHRYEVIAYEIGPRAGLSVKEVLEKMLNDSSIAFLVLTGEDITNYGEVYARQNVVHELGLFQGRLGFNKAIALLEEGVVEFSNIYGINQIRFSKDNIRESFGDVLATIKREFE
jgi:predicted nucleotide-binding protein